MHKISKCSRFSEFYLCILGLFANHNNSPTSIYQSLPQTIFKYLQIYVLVQHEGYGTHKHAVINWQLYIHTQIFILMLS